LVTVTTADDTPTVSTLCSRQRKQKEWKSKISQDSLKVHVQKQKYLQCTTSTFCNVFRVLHHGHVWLWTHKSVQEKSDSVQFLLFDCERSCSRDSQQMSITETDITDWDVVVPWLWNFCQTNGLTKKSFCGHTHW
jgi:hypothetical protein